MNLRRDIVVVGASAGGIAALKRLMSELPAEFPAAVFVVQHTAPDSPGLLPSILDPVCAMPVAFPQDGAPIQSGHVYIAPPDRHLLVDRGLIRVTRGPRENRFRPSIDVLFRSAAWACGSRVIGVILTGYLDDGAAGLYCIKACGGSVVVQSPQDAEVPDMPRNAMRRVQADEIVPLDQMAKLLTLLVAEPVEQQGGSAVSDEERQRMEIEVGIAREDDAIDMGVLSLGNPSLFTCPECHGVLLKIKEGEDSRFRCHTGHAYSFDSLLAEITKSSEDSLWTSLRAIQETQLLLAHMADHLREGGDTDALALIEKKLHEIKRREELVREAILNHDALSEDKLHHDAEE